MILIASLENTLRFIMPIQDLFFISLAVCCSVDSQLNAKLADLELGISSPIEKNSKPSKNPIKNSAKNSAKNGAKSRNGKGSISAALSGALSGSSKGKGGADKLEDGLMGYASDSDDEDTCNESDDGLFKRGFLANWLAPEVCISILLCCYHLSYFQ
jgi:hypothetical protein